MGGYAKSLPFECFSLSICLLFLAGAPCTLGFFMKHYLLASIPVTGLYFNVITVLLFSSACLGIVYCSRLYYGVFYGLKKSSIFIYNSPNKFKYYYYDTNSTMYTNTTLAASFAIGGLILVGSLICWLLLLFMLHKFFNTAAFGSSLFKATIHCLVENVS